MTEKNTAEQILHIPSYENEERIRKAIEKNFDFVKLMAYYKCAMMEIETKFNVLNEEYALQFDRNPINSIKTRLKNPVSIYQKAAKKEIPFTADMIEKNIRDVAGIRVVCSFVDDVYLLANALLMQDDITLVERKDYIQNPKENGYRSLHLIVAVPIFLAQEKRIMNAEIQLRTIAMDFWASLEHQLAYKKETEFTEAEKAELLDCATVSAELDGRMNLLHQNMDRMSKTADASKHAR